MNLRSEWFKRNTQSESIRRIPTSDSWGLKDWSGFTRIQSLGLTRIETDWFLTGELHQTRLKTFFVLTPMSSDWRGNRFRNKSDWFGMNFNPKFSPGRFSAVPLYSRVDAIQWGLKRGRELSKRYCRSKKDMWSSGWMALKEPEPKNIYMGRKMISDLGWCWFYFNVTC